MTAVMKRAMAAYGVQSLDSDVNTASPHRLIVLLYDGAIKAICLAKTQMELGNIAEKGKSISKAIAIIEDGLRLSLDKERGGELAESLDSLYEYMSQTLLEANLRNDLTKLDQVILLLKDLQDAWASISSAEALKAPPPERASQHGQV